MTKREDCAPVERVRFDWVLEAFRSNARAVKEQKGWTYENLAQAYADCGMGTKGISVLRKMIGEEVEGGRSRISLDEAFELAHALGVPFHDLIQAKESRWDPAGPDGHFAFTKALLTATAEEGTCYRVVSRIPTYAILPASLASYFHRLRFADEPKAAEGYDGLAEFVKRHFAGAEAAKRPPIVNCIHEEFFRELPKLARLMPDGERREFRDLLTMAARGPSPIAIRLIEGGAYPVPFEMAVVGGALAAWRPTGGREVYWSREAPALNGLLNAYTAAGERSRALHIEDIACLG